MKLFALAFVVAAAAAAPQLNSQQQFNNQEQYFTSGQPEVRIVKQKFEQDLVGNYEYAYEQDNGQKVQENGRVQPGPEPETGSIEQQGSYEFIGDDGNTYRVDYLANEKGGFQAQGAHLPQAPAQIPEYAQLRRDYPQLFWAENGGAGVVASNQQFDNQQFDNQQFNNQQFDNQQFGNQQFDNQQFDNQQFSNQQFDNQQFSNQQFDNQQFIQQQQINGDQGFNGPQLVDQQLSQPQLVSQQQQYDGQSQFDLPLV